MKSDAATAARPLRWAIISQRRAHSIAESTSSASTPVLRGVELRNIRASQRCSAVRPTSRIACWMDSIPLPPAAAEFTMRSSL